MKVGDDYFDSAEFSKLLNAYETSVNAGEPVFMDADELTDIADYYQYTGRTDEAEKAISLALSLSPGAIAPLTYRIHEALSKGDTQRAWQMLGQVIDTDDPDYVYCKAKIMIAEGRIEDADTYLREELKKVPPEEHQDFVVDAATIYNDYGIGEKAMEWMSRAKQENTSDFKELMARTLFELGKYKESERLFNELLDADPFQKRYWNALASAQFMNEDYRNAIESSEYAIAIDPNDLEGIISKANGLYRLCNFEQALDYYNRYLEHEPADEFALLHKGTCLMNIGLTDEAIEVLKGIVQAAAPDSPYLPDIHEELAFAYSEKGEYDKAMSCLAKTDTMECDHCQMLLIKGHIMLAAGKLVEAEEYFRKAIENSENSMQTLLRVIVSLYENKYLEGSYKMFKKYFIMAEKMAIYGNTEQTTEGYAYMALCCHDLKKWDEYLKYLKKACEVNPKECRMVLSHLFPEELEPEKYYDYLKNKMGNA